MSKYFKKSSEQVPEKIRNRVKKQLDFLEKISILQGIITTIRNSK